jgi:hypothetical protein
VPRRCVCAGLRLMNSSVCSSRIGIVLAIILLCVWRDKSQDVRDSAVSPRDATSMIELGNGLNEFFIVSPSQGGRFSAASRQMGKQQNAASPRRGEAESGRAYRAGSRRRRGGAEWSERPIIRRAGRNRPPNGDRENADRMSFRPGAGPRGRDKGCPLTQVPAEAAARVARVASRTNRATVRAEVKMSAKIDALALLARPNQGERFTPCRAWSALRLSA